MGGHGGNARPIFSKFKAYRVFNEIFLKKYLLKHNQTIKFANNST